MVYCPNELHFPITKDPISHGTMHFVQRHPLEAVGPSPKFQAGGYAVLWAKPLGSHTVPAWKLHAQSGFESPYFCCLETSKFNFPHCPSTHSCIAWKSSNMIRALDTAWHPSSSARHPSSSPANSPAVWEKTVQRSKTKHSPAWQNSLLNPPKANPVSM